MSDTRVTLITPCYNAEKFIGHTIASVQAQTLTCWEMIVVDDGSVDNSARIIDQYAAVEARVRLVKQANMGMLTARVNAYPSVSATTEYLLFLDADDLIAPEMLERMVGYLDVHPEVGMAHCKDNLIDQNNLPTASEDRVTCRCVPGGGFLKNVPDTVPLTAPESLAWWSPVIPSTSLIRRTVYEEVGGWDEPLRYGHEDADLFLRISLKYPVHLVPEVLTSYRLHPAQMTKKHLFLQREHLQFHKKWLRGAHLNKEDRHWFRRTWLLYEAWLAPQFFLRCSAKKLASGDIIGSAVCFARIWKHYAMVLTAPAREILW